MEERGFVLPRATVRPLEPFEDGVESRDVELHCRVLKGSVNRFETSWAPRGRDLGMEGKNFGAPTPSVLPVEALEDGVASDAVAALPVGEFRRDSV